MTRHVKRGRGKRIPKAASRSPKPVVHERVAILESDVDIDKLCRDFEVNDEQDIDDILTGRIGEVDQDQWGD